MEKKLDELLQKTSFWMNALGGIFTIFNLFCWVIFFLYTFVYGFGNNGLRALCGFLCLCLSSYVGLIALNAASKIKDYQIRRETSSLKEAFQIEAHFWNYLLFLVLGGIATMIFIIIFQI